MPRRPSHAAPPRALMVTIMLCLTALLLGYVTYPGLYQSPVLAAGVTPSSTPETPLWTASAPAPTVTPTPTPEVTQSGLPEDTLPPEESTPTADPLPPGVDPPAIPVDHDYGQSVPEGETADPETWFKDAVFIGDSRTDGFHLYSGVKGGTYLVHTGLTVFEVVDRAAVLGSGDNKYSVLSALGKKQYGKVYLSLGINELGWFDAQAYAEAFGKLVDAVREVQPYAAVYVQSIVPVCPSACKSHGQPYYVTNANISDYNQALAQMCTDKEVLFLNVSEALVDPDTWELPADMTHDGVHFKRAGYQTWLAYLLCHTGEGVSAPQETPEPTPEPTPSPTPRPEMPPEAPPAIPESSVGPAG